MIVYKLVNILMIKERIAQERNPFADSASMLLRVMLAGPLKPWRIRELSRMAGISPTLAILALRRLERLGHVSRESTAEARILDPVRLLNEWAAWYSIKALESFRFALAEPAGPETILKLLSKTRNQLPGQWALASMAGASLVSPYANFKEVHIHLPKADDLRRSWQDVLKLTPDKLGTIHLTEPYYLDSGSFGRREIQKLPVVSDIQLYLDCYRYPVRGREQAGRLLSRMIMPRWKNAR